MTDGRWLAAAVLCAALLAAGCSRQETAYQEARAADTVAAYRAYLRDFPAGTHAAEARARLQWWLEEDDWQRAARLGTPEAFQRYLGAHPDGRHATEARQRLAALVASGEPPPREAPALASGPSTWIQLGAFAGEPAASQAWSVLLASHPDLLGDLAPRIEQVSPEADQLWRLLAGPIARQDASERCARLEADGSTCFVTTR